MIVPAPPPYLGSRELGSMEAARDRAASAHLDVLLQGLAANRVRSLSL
jgi:hypothetical protein